MKRRDTIVRYTAPERINHWITAFCFILAAVSGLGFLFPSFNWLMQIMGTPQLARILHPFVGVVMFASFIIMFFRYWHHNLINRDDIFWAKNIRKIVVNEEVGDTGRYNFGQKCVFIDSFVSSTSSPSSALAAVIALRAVRSTFRASTRKTTASTNVRCALTAWWLGKNQPA